MIKERPDDLWEKHYVRRKENDSKGYQSAIGEMYKALGDEVVLNTCDLVLKTMSKCLDPEVKFLSFPFSENAFFGLMISESCYLSFNSCVLPKKKNLHE